MRRWTLFLLLTGIGFGSSTSLGAMALHSQQAYLIDLTTHTVLFEKNAQEVVPPSSMSKLMTAYIVFKELKAGHLRMTDRFFVSEKAWKKPGSRMFLKAYSQVTVSDLLRGLIVQSGNDAAIALAEGVMGDEKTFAEHMTREARHMGTTHTTFKNATGWPDEGHLSTMKDLALIAQRSIENFPSYYFLYGETDFTFNNIKQKNRNPLLYANLGADGLKTGHTEAAGYGVVASARQAGRRLILAINGAQTKRQRAEDAKKLMRWGFSYFTSPKLVRAHHPLEKVDVWLGQTASVPMILEEDVYITVPRHQLKKVSAKLVYSNPVEAPVKVGQVLGKLVVTLPDQRTFEKPLVAGRSIERARFFERIKAAFVYLLWGHN